MLFPEIGFMSLEGGKNASYIPFTIKEKYPHILDTRTRTKVPGISKMNSICIRPELFNQ